ncbi:MAG: NAD(P)-dependent oxidoreductase [Opitutus sp.]
MTKIIGFIGTGLMGRGMARCLIRRGFEVRLYNRTRQRAEEVAELGGKIVATPAEAAEGAEVIVTMLANPQALLEAVQGKDGLLNSIAAGAVLIDSSTVSPPTTLRVRELLQARGAEMIDAPVFGSRNEAENGTLGFIVGGQTEVLARIQPVLDAMGRTLYVGTNGLGASAKLVVNLVIGGTLQAFNEGMVLAAKAGIDPEVMVQIIQSSRAKSGIIEMKAPRILSRDFTPFFPLQLMAKDLRLVVEAARSLELQLPLATLLSSVYEGCLAAGLAEEDYAASIKSVEVPGKIEVKARANGSIVLPQNRT